MSNKHNFKIGDTVRRKTGGQEMKVIWSLPESDDIQCEWDELLVTTSQQITLKKYFKSDELEKVEDLR